jgi:hypothetical protein
VIEIKIIIYVLVHINNSKQLSFIENYQFHMRHVGFEGQTIFKAIDNQCQVLFIILKNFTVTSVVAAQSNCVLSWAHISV